MQNICLENEARKSEIDQMKFEIEDRSIDIKDNSLHHDFVTINSDSDKSKISAFIKCS